MPYLWAERLNKSMPRFSGDRCGRPTSFGYGLVAGAWKKQITRWAALSAAIVWMFEKRTDGSGAKAMGRL
jgi:hypothetical protein